MKFQIPPENIGAYDREWCYDCERHTEDCVCEQLCDHFRGILPVNVPPEPIAADEGEKTNPTTVIGEARESTTLSGSSPAVADRVLIPAASEHPFRGAEQEPYTFEESDERRRQEHVLD